MADVAERLLSLKKQIDEAKSKKDQYTGRLAGLQQRLKEEFGCDTVPQARKILAELTEEIETAEQKLEDGLEALEEQLG